MGSVDRVVALTRAARYGEALREWNALGAARLVHPGLLEIGAALQEQLQHPRDAADLWLRLHHLRPDDPKVVASFADLALAAHQEDRARTVLVRFVTDHRGLDAALERRAASLLARHAARLEDTRDPAGARAAASAALDLDGENTLAARILVRLDHQEGHYDAARERALGLLAQPASDRDRSALYLELALIERRLGRVDAAFEAASVGKKLARSVYHAAGVQLDHYPALLRRVRGWSGRWPSLAPSARRDPVLMVGFPRSGTTLLQQILQAHPAVQTLDEVDPAFGVLRDHFRGAPVQYPDCLDLLTDDEWNWLREAYFAAVDARNLPEHDVLVDKLPLNVVRLDYLVRLFPHAKVVMCLRDPRDVVLSNFFQDFEMNAAMAQFTDLEDTAHTYAGVMDLWLERRDRLPVPYQEVRYEDLTADTERTVRALLHFFGLPWDPAVLAHYEGAAHRQISTPSRYDASKPVYREAVGRWRAFEQHLAPVLDVLAPYAAALGYSVTN